MGRAARLRGMPLFRAPRGTRDLLRVASYNVHRAIGTDRKCSRERILDLSAESLHQRVPLIMGSSNEVRRVAELHCDPLLVASGSAPLFARRGFFRL